MFKPCVKPLRAEDLCLIFASIPLRQVNWLGIRRFDGFLTTWLKSSLFWSTPFTLPQAKKISKCYFHEVHHRFYHQPITTSKKLACRLTLCRRFVWPYVLTRKQVVQSVSKHCQFAFKFRHTRTGSTSY